MSVNNISLTNFYPKTNLLKQQFTKTKQNETSSQKSDITSEVANAIKNQALYQSSKKNAQYLSDNLSRKEIISALKNKNEMGRDFWGQKSKVANIITKADDTKLATENFNIIMNAKDKKLIATDIADILMVATTINNKKMDEKLMKEYGFTGGTLDDKSIDSILNKIKELRKQQQFILMQQHMMQNEFINQQNLQNQILQDQMMQQQILQQHMMATPGMGFC